jgi:hypothetical protein
MVANASANPKYQLKFVGNPRTDEAKMKSLASAGPLLAAKEQVLAALLPDAWGREEHAPDVAIPMGDIHSILLPGTLLDSTSAKQGLHMAVEPGRLASLMQALDDAGMDWTPIRGSASEAVPKATARVTAALLALPDDQRTIAAEHIMHDGDADNPATDTWYDWVCPHMLMAGGGGMAAVAEFMALVPDAIFSGEPGGREDGTFQAAVEQMAASVGRDISSLGSSAQAAAVVAWFKRTRPPAGLAAYVDDYTMEIERRAGATPAERFEPLFKAGWRTAYPLLDQLWPSPVDDIITDTGALASALGVNAADGLTPRTLTAISNELADVISFAASEDNVRRTAEVRRAAKLADQGGDKKEDLSADAKAQLQSDQSFQAFKAEVEACGIDEHTRMAEVMLRATHGAGLLFLNGKLNHDKFWKERAGARTDSAIQSAFNKAVSYTTANNPAEWGSVLPASTAKKLVAGRLTLDWWEALQPVIAKRNGLTTAARIDARLKGKPATAVYGDSEAMRMLEKPARACVDLIGMATRDSRSFSSLWQTVMRMAVSVEGLPKSCRYTKGLRRRLEEAAGQCMKCVQDRFEAMLATPVTAVRRVTQFVIDGQALNAVNAIDDHINRIVQEVDDGLHGHPRDPNSFTREDDDDEVAPTQKKPKKKLEEAPQEEVEWGSAARINGITTDADGKRIAFGKNVALFDAAPDITTHCVARMAPGKSAYWRSKWCPNPDKCWRAHGDDAHTRLDDYPDAACRAVDAGSVPGGIDWADFSNVIIPPSQAPSGGVRQGRGAGRRGGRGQGGAKGGKGGKGAKGGGAKGKGGKGRQSFGRQQQ